MRRGARTGRGPFRMPVLATVLLAALLAGCVSIPTGGGVTTDQIDTTNPDEDLTTLPPGPQEDASPAEIIDGFISAGRGPQDNYKVAREYLTDEFSTDWVPGARTLISSTPIDPVALADNTWSVRVTTSAGVDADGVYSVSSDTEELAFGLVQDEEGQWRINSAPDGTLLPPNRFASTFSKHELYFFDSTFQFLVPDLRWFPNGASAGRRLVDELLQGPAEWQGAGVLFSAFPSGTTREDGPEINAGVATVGLTSEVQAQDDVTKQRMLQQLTASLRSIGSVREVAMVSAGFTVDVPDGGGTPDSQYRVRNDPIGGIDGRVGLLTEEGLTSLAAVGTAADALGANAGSLSRDGDAMALRGSAGVSLVTDGGEPVPLDGRAGLIAPSLDSSGYTWTVPAGNAGALHATAADGTVIEVPGLPDDATIVSLDVSRDGARVLAALATPSGPRLLVAGVRRDGQNAPIELGPAIDLPVGSEPLIDAAWVDGVTVVALSGQGEDTSVASYEIGGQRVARGSVAAGRTIVGGNDFDGTRVLDAEGRVLRPGGGSTWQDTGIVASFLATQQ